MLVGMVGRVAYLITGMTLAALAVGCGSNRASVPRAEWRAQTEARCLASGKIRASAYIRAASKVGGRACGMERPLKVSGLLGGRVAVKPTATINCPLTAALNRWIASSVQPAARRNFGETVVGIRQIASYGCRGRNGSRRGPLSEHAFGNALDVANLRLARGREVSVVRGWRRGNPREQAFLRAAFTGACREFYTVLGPGSDRHHYDHFHLDLLRANARGGRHYCRPVPGRFGTPTAALPARPAGGTPKRPLSLAGPQPE